MRLIIAALPQRATACHNLMFTLFHALNRDATQLSIFSSFFLTSTSLHQTQCSGVSHHKSVTVTSEPAGVTDTAQGVCAREDRAVIDTDKQQIAAVHFISTVARAIMSCNLQTVIYTTKSYSPTPRNH